MDRTPPFSLFVRRARRVALSRTPALVVVGGLGGSVCVCARLQAKPSHVSEPHTLTQHLPSHTRLPHIALCTLKEVECGGLVADNSQTWRQQCKHDACFVTLLAAHAPLKQRCAHGMPNDGSGRARALSRSVADPRPVHHNPCVISPIHSHTHASLSLRPRFGKP
jgi:hypothetical protein